MNPSTPRPKGRGWAKRYPQVAEIKQKLLESGANGALMPGTGPVVFGIFDDERKARKSKKILEDEVDEVF
ncbi:hypothetical protein [Candidatus Hakubella thermalkaliphila]|nr:hypothetical protein [Candidatus Hakubella thermalkaliphila]